MDLRSAVSHFTFFAPRNHRSWFRNLAYPIRYGISHNRHCKLTTPEGQDKNSRAYRTSLPQTWIPVICSRTYMPIQEGTESVYRQMTSRGRSGELGSLSSDLDSQALAFCAEVNTAAQIVFFMDPGSASRTGFTYGVF